MSDVNALKGMFHELKDKFEALKMENFMEAMAQKSGDASEQVTSFTMLQLQGHDQARLVRPGAGMFHTWNELFVSYLMSIDRKWCLILTTLQMKDAA